MFATLSDRLADTFKKSSAGSPRRADGTDPAVPAKNSDRSIARESTASRSGSSAGNPRQIVNDEALGPSLRRHRPAAAL